MTAINPEHLFQQAEILATAPPAGRPKQADIRRAISAAYYGVFHFVIMAAADQFIGVTKRATSEYGRVYRSIDHRALRELCDDMKKPIPLAKYNPHLPKGGVGPNIAAFAAAIVELQEIKTWCGLRPNDPRQNFGRKVGSRNRSCRNSPIQEGEVCATKSIFKPSAVPAATLNKRGMIFI